MRKMVAYKVIELWIDLTVHIKMYHLFPIFRYFFIPQNSVRLINVSGLRYTAIITTVD